MNERLSGLLITLDDDTREDDAEHTIAAIRQIKGVLSVQGLSVNPTFQMACERVRADLRTRLYEVLR